MNIGEKIRNLILLILISTPCFGQKYINELYDFDTQQFESFTAVSQLKDSGYVAAGFSVKMGYGYNYFAVQTDKKGVITNKVCYQIPYKEISLASPFKTVNDSEFICAGIIVDQDTNLDRINRDFLLLKINQYGDTIWTKRHWFGIGTIANPDFETAFDVIPTQDKGFAMTGYSSNFAGGNNQICLIKTDSLGNLLWQQSYGGGGSENGNSLIETPDKGFLLVGYTYSYGNGDRDGYLIKTDSLGNFQWQKTYGGGNDGLSGISKAIDGNYLLTGWFNYNSTNLKPWLIKVNDSGNIIWDKTYGSGQVHGSLYQSHQLNDSSIVVFGNVKDTIGVPYAGLLMKTTYTGDSLWAREYKRATTMDDYFNGFNTTNDGGFILAGQVPGQATPSGTQDGWIVKVDCMGADSITHYFGDTCYTNQIGIKEIITERNGVLLDNYPNPFSERTTLSYYAPSFTANVSITISDLTGRILQTYLIKGNEGELEFKASDLPAGIYYCTLMQNNKTVAVKKMVLMK